MGHLIVYDFLSLTPKSKVYCTTRVALIKAGYSLVQPCWNITKRVLHYFTLFLYSFFVLKCVQFYLCINCGYVCEIIDVTKCERIFNQSFYCDIFWSSSILFKKCDRPLRFTDNDMASYYRILIKLKARIAHNHVTKMIAWSLTLNLSYSRQTNNLEGKVS